MPDEKNNDEQKSKKDAAPKSDESKAPQPTVGRVVIYYTDPDGQQRPALITEVDGVSVSLTIFNSLGSHFRDDVPFAPVPTPGHWSWPERN